MSWFVYPDWLDFIDDQLYVREEDEDDGATWDTPVSNAVARYTMRIDDIRNGR